LLTKPVMKTKFSMKIITLIWEVLRENFYRG